MDLSTGKRQGDSADLPRNAKRSKCSNEEEELIVNETNFLKACQQVSHRNYLNYHLRFQLVYLPSCVTGICSHRDGNVFKIPNRNEASFGTEILNKTWYEAIETCRISINPSHYLPANVLIDIVEIILNAHDGSEYTAKHIVEMCQEILALNLSTHPPCNENLRECYSNFLTSPMNSTIFNEKSRSLFTTRNDYECDKGIVKYCLNRLEYELQAISKDGPLVAKDRNIPEDIKGKIRESHWQKENLEIFETINRQERVDRLFAVLETVVELLQFDLALTLYSRTTIYNRGRPVRRRKLMKLFEFTKNTTVVDVNSGNCRQILQIFIIMIHLRYPNAKVKIITAWLNVIIQTMYMQDQYADLDYPNIKSSKLCDAFATDFYNKIISGNLPYDSIIRILENIEPPFMRYLVGLEHTKKVLSATIYDDQTCIINIFTNFINGQHWKSHPTDNTQIKLSNKLHHTPTKVPEKLKYLLEKCDDTDPRLDVANNIVYGKMEHILEGRRKTASLNHIVHTLYVTLHAYLESYDLQTVLELWANLNKTGTDIDYILTEQSSVSDFLINHYVLMLNTLRGFVCSYNKKSSILPAEFNIFSKIGSLQINKLNESTVNINYKRLKVTAPISID